MVFDMLAYFHDGLAYLLNATEGFALESILLAYVPLCSKCSFSHAIFVHYLWRSSEPAWER